MIKLKDSVYLISSKNDGEEFWKSMGSFFASKEVRKEFNGYPLNDSEHHLWFVKFDENKKVSSFLGTSWESKETIWITEIYTVPQHRKNKLSTLLIDTLLEYIQDKQVSKIKVVVQAKSPLHRTFKKRKFKIDCMKGSYTYYSKEIKEVKEIKEIKEVK